MFMQPKAVFATFAGVIAAFATWLLVDASGLTASEFIYNGDSAVGGDKSGYFLYQFAFALLLCLMTAAADAVFRETPEQRRNTYLIALACGFVGGLLGPGIGLAFAAMFPVPQADPDGTSGRFLFNVFLLAFGWSVVGAAAGAIPGIARRSAWIAQRGAIGGAAGTLAGAFLFQISTSIFDADTSFGLFWRLGAIVLTGGLSSYLAYFIPDVTKQVWLKVVDKRGKGPEYIIARSPFRIGKDSACDIVPLDTKGVAPIHLIIEAIPRTNRHRLRHAARSPGGRAIYAITEVNDEPMTSEKWLSNGDKISVSDLVYEFHDKATYVEKPEPPRIQDRPYAEDRNWELQSKTTAISRSILPVLDELDAEPVPATAKSSARAQTALRDKPVEAETAATAEVAFKSIGTRLACIGGPYQGQSFPLTHQEALIGRSLDHTVALPADTSVSRVHARIVYEGGRHHISDAGSQNGLLVNDELVDAPRTLEIADIIKLGATVLRYE